MLGDKKKYKLLKCYVYLQGSSQKIWKSFWGESLEKFTSIQGQNTSIMASDSCICFRLHSLNVPKTLYH
jgi:hypothetical protein